MTVHVIHENPEWFPPFAAAFDAEGLAYHELLLDGGVVDLDRPPEPGIYWSRMSASAHSRGHALAKEHTRAVLSWLEAAGCRVVNGRRVLEMEMSKVDQLCALRASGIDVPRTVAVVGGDDLVAAAATLPTPFIAKPNQGGKGLGVMRFETAAALADHLASSEYEPPVDGITLLQEYLEPAQAFITRVEIVGRELLYAITADTARGGFQLCPADACAVDGAGSEAAAGLFALCEDVDPAMVSAYLGFARRQGIEIAGFEFIETSDGRKVTYDVNTNTNYNPEVEAVAPCSGPREIARYLRRLLDREAA